MFALVFISITADILIYTQLTPINITHLVINLKEKKQEVVHGSKSPLENIGLRRGGWSKLNCVPTAIINSSLTHSLSHTHTHTHTLTHTHRVHSLYGPDMEFRITCVWLQVCVLSSLKSFPKLPPTKLIILTKNLAEEMVETLLLKDPRSDRWKGTYWISVPYSKNHYCWIPNRAVS